jgi:hypothetical protein
MHLLCADTFDRTCPSMQVHFGVQSMPDCKDILYSLGDYPGIIHVAKTSSWVLTRDWALAQDACYHMYVYICDGTTVMSLKKFYYYNNIM